MCFDDEPEQEGKKVKERKNKSLARKIAAAVMEYAGLTNEWDSDRNTRTEKEYAKVIKKVIRRHDAGK